MGDLVLFHYGIKGMRWGIRRYQNKDGTLTAAGKKRAAKLRNELDSLEGKKKDDEGGSSKSATSSKPKSVKEMSDNELRDYVNRLRNERDALDLNRQISSMTAQQKSAGEKIVSDVIAPALKESSRNLMRDKLTQLGKEYLGLNQKEQQDAFQTLKKEVQTMQLQKQKDQLTKEFAQTKADADKAASDAKKQADAQKQVDDYNNSGHKDDSVTRTDNERKSSDIYSSRTETGNGSRLRLEQVDRFVATGKDIIGEGTSRYTKDPSPVIDADYKEVVNNRATTSGRGYVRNLLEGHNIYYLEDKRRGA